MPIRVCHLITSLDIGGAERNLVNLVTAMNRDEFENEVVTLLKPGPMAQPLVQAGIPVTSMEIGRNLPNPAVLLSLVRHLRTNRPTILQTWLYHADFFGTAAALFTRPEHLLWNVRSSNIREPGIPRSTQFLARLLAMLSRRPDAIIVNSQDGRQYHDRIGYRPKQWINIPNGVDLERFFPRPSDRAILRSRLGLSADAVVIGLVARYHPMKDVETFLRAASFFQQDHANAKFLLCGDGLCSDNAPLLERVRSLKLDRHAVLLGPRPDIELIYPTLDALTLCSIYGEGFPNVLCEAMACDVPCVATDVGDSAEILGGCGLIVPPRNPQTLSDAWRTLIEKGPRFGGGGGRARVTARYSLQQMCRHYESLYRSLAQKPRNRRDWHWSPQQAAAMPADTDNNLDLRVASGFGREWSTFRQDADHLTREQRQAIFDDYFRIFPWHLLPPGGGVGMDVGCGTGRWSVLVAPRVQHLHLLDPSAEALNVAKQNLSVARNVTYHLHSVANIPLPSKSLDFAFSLGVLHHVPDTQTAIAAIADKLKPNAPFLVYLYYAFDNRPAWYRVLWRISDLARFVVSRLPHPLRLAFSQIIAAVIYWPLARVALFLARRGRSLGAFPLSYYTDKSFYVMRTDAYDRFCTRLEKRFRRSEIERMLTHAGFRNVTFSSKQPFWCAVGVKSG